MTRRRGKRFLTRSVDTASDYALDLQRSGVNEPRRMRAHAIGGVLMFLVGLVSLFVLTYAAAPSPLTAAAGPVLGLILGGGAMGRLRRAGAYRTGWLEGRLTMIRALEEATRRGLSLGDWLGAEAERDAVIFGGDRDGDDV